MLAGRKSPCQASSVSSGQLAQWSQSFGWARDPLQQQPRKQTEAPSSSAHFTMPESPGIQALSAIRRPTTTRDGLDVTWSLTVAPHWGGPEGQTETQPAQGA